jgi:hypothetical protein
MGKKDKNKNIGKEIDVSKIDMERLKEQAASLPSVLEYAHSRSGALINPEDQGKLKSRALDAMHEQTKREFKQVIKQITPLIEQVEKLKKRVYLSEMIYTAHIPFEPFIGQIYYLYRKKDGTTLLSMIGPNEWGKGHPYEAFEGEVKLLSDHTWEVVDDEEDNDDVEAD